MIRGRPATSAAQTCHSSPGAYRSCMVDNIALSGVSDRPSLRWWFRFRNNIRADQYRRHTLPSVLRAGWFFCNLFLVERKQLYVSPNTLMLLRPTLTIGRPCEKCLILDVFISAQMRKRLGLPTFGACGLCNYGIKTIARSNLEILL